MTAYPPRDFCYERPFLLSVPAAVAWANQFNNPIEFSSRRRWHLGDYCHYMPAQNIITERMAALYDRVKEKLMRDFW